MPNADRTDRLAVLGALVDRLERTPCPPEHAEQLRPGGVQADPLDDQVRAGDQRSGGHHERRGRRVPGHGHVERLQAPWTDRDRPAGPVGDRVHASPDPHREQQPFGVVAGGNGLLRDRGPFGPERREQHGGLDLGARHREPIPDASEAAAPKDHRRAPARRLHPGAHQPERFGHPLHRTAEQLRIPGQPGPHGRAGHGARDEAHRRPGPPAVQVAGVDGAGPGAVLEERRTAHGDLTVALGDRGPEGADDPEGGPAVAGR